MKKQQKSLEREIIFRAKRKDTSEWLEGYIHKMDGYGTGYTEYGIQVQDIPTSRPWSVLVKSETVGQFTGLADKNNNRIFEGDILLKGFERVVVNWNENQCRWGIYIDEYEISGFNESTKNYFEVIGNIHDNPELLRTPQNDEVRE